MCLDNYEMVMVIILLGCSFIMIYILILGILEFRKSNKEFEAFVNERKKMNRQLSKK